jgi:dihydrofolate reductase
MRKIILNVAVSLDGYIEGPNGEYDWCFADQDYGMAEFFNATDAIFMGRKSFELIGSDPSAFAGKQLYVFSDTLTKVQNDTIEVVPRADYLQKVEEIKNGPGNNIWLFGGASLVSTFTSNDLINEILLSVHPVILGGGKPLFEHIQNRIDLMLVNHEVYSSGLIQLTYVRKPKFDFDILRGIKV